MAKDRPHNISPPKGVHLRMVRIKIVRKMPHCRIGHKPIPAGSMKVAHPCTTNVGVGGTLAITALVPRTTPNKG